MASAGEVRLGAAGGLGLDGGVLEDRLDHEVAAGERGVVGGGGDAGEDGVALLGVVRLRLTPSSKQAVGVGLALVGGGLVAVDQHDLDAGLGGDVGDAGAHHAGAEDAELPHALVGRAGRGRRPSPAPAC